MKDLNENLQVDLLMAVFNQTLYILIKKNPTLKGMLSSELYLSEFFFIRSRAQHMFRPLER